jgi:rRNA maturation protein Nop10
MTDPQQQPPESRRPAERPPAPPPPNYTLATVCPSCGTDTFRLACKVRCPRCGFMWDCSET